MKLSSKNMRLVDGHEQGHTSLYVDKKIDERYSIFADYDALTKLIEQTGIDASTHRILATTGTNHVQSRRNNTQRVGVDDGHDYLIQHITEGALRLSETTGKRYPSAHAVTMGGLAVTFAGSVYAEQGLIALGAGVCIGIAAADKLNAYDDEVSEPRNNRQRALVQKYHEAVLIEPTLQTGSLGAIVPRSNEEI